MLQPKTVRAPATRPARVSGRRIRANVCHGRAPRHAAASSRVGSTLLRAVPMLRTMNGNVKIDIAKTTDGRLKRASVLAMPRAWRIGVAGPPGGRGERNPQTEVKRPHNRETH